MGDPNASIPTAEPQFYRPMFGAHPSVVGRTCLTFVSQAAYDAGGAVQSFAADYEQHCEGGIPALYGSVRINSSVSVESRLSVGGVTRYEGNSGTANAAFVVSLSAPSASIVTVSYATAAGTATAGDDYQSVSGTLTFLPPVTSLTVNVPVIGDQAVEGDETRRYGDTAVTFIHRP